MKVLALVLVLLTGCTAHRAAAAAATGQPPVPLPACLSSAAHDELPLGPATGHVSGNLVTSTFAFTRDLVIAPPPRGYRPVVTAAQARCELHSAVSTGPVGLGQVALATVTLTGAQSFGRPPYKARVAWIDIAYSSDVAPSCPAGAEPSTSPAAQWPTPAGGPQQVVAVDAATGASALFYEEHYTCTGNPPAPTAGVPLQVQSLPWTLISRTGGTLTLRAGWPSCEAFAANQAVGRRRALTQ